jgi:hypothetical protein
MSLSFFFFFFSFAFASDEPSLRIYDLDEFPKFQYSDIIEFYYLEAAFPFTTPPSLVEESGDQWTQYSLSHSGLGIWNKDLHLKLSLEFICHDYIGALLPLLVTVPVPVTVTVPITVTEEEEEELTTLQWNNTGSIVLTKPMNESYWAESRLVAVSNGAAYEALVQYLKDHEKRYARYQVHSSI